MSSVILKATRATGASETHDRGAYDRAEAAYKAAKADLDSVKDADMVKAVEAKTRTTRERPYLDLGMRSRSWAYPVCDRPHSASSYSIDFRTPPEKISPNMP